MADALMCDAGASNKTEVVVRSVTVAPGGASRRHLLAAGVVVDTRINFAAGAAAAALALADGLRSEPQALLPAELFGAVTVPRVTVTTPLSAGTWAGIGTGVAAGVAGARRRAQRSRVDEMV
jgi:hypothetical protein